MTNCELFFCFHVKSFNLRQVELLLSLKLFFTILTKGFPTLYDVDDDNDVMDGIEDGDGDVGDNEEDGDGDDDNDKDGDGDDDALKASMMK